MIKKQQKEFAYIDFATEADCQEALKNHEDVSSGDLVRSHKLINRKSEIPPFQSSSPILPRFNLNSVDEDEVETEVSEVLGAVVEGA